MGHELGSTFPDIICSVWTPIAAEGLRETAWRTRRASEACWPLPWHVRGAGHTDHTKRYLSEHGSYQRFLTCIINDPNMSLSKDGGTHMASPSEAGTPRYESATCHTHEMCLSLPWTPNLKVKDGCSDYFTLIWWLSHPNEITCWEHLGTPAQWSICPYKSYTETHYLWKTWEVYSIHQ